MCGSCWKLIYASKVRIIFCSERHCKVFCLYFVGVWEVNCRTRLATYYVQSGLAQNVADMLREPASARGEAVKKCGHMELSSN